MNRLFCSVIMLTALSLFGNVQWVSAQPSSGQSREVDAKTFLIAFQKDKAAQYKGFRVIGTGAEFVEITHDGKTALQLFIGVLESDGKARASTTMLDWLRSEIAGTALQLQLRGPNLKRKVTDTGESIAGPTYTFSGRFSGDTVTIPRTVSSGGRFLNSTIPVLTDSEAQ